MVPVTINNKIAITPLKCDKIEAKVTGGFAQISRNDVIAVKIVLPYDDPTRELYLRSGSFVFVRSSSAFKPWNKEVYRLREMDLDFVMCPIEEVIGYYPSEDE